MSFNKVIIVGNLGRDPELRYTPQGDAVCSFSVATNERKKDKSGEFQDVTTWFKITLWRRLAENASKYLTKGSPVYVEGRLQVEEWTDRDGKERFTLGVQATDMHFISGRGEGGGGEYSGGGGRDDFETHSGPPQASSSSSSASAGGSTSAPVSAPAAADDDIPF
ncbi:MAG: single-stranded DNA-binding protein [Acidobacteria bacterium]|nr:single-stranded DNA-binding protein [Acidobacteriota bacterium]MBK9530130.1 single-stranded DNA-binding protein [Acidobacteriota bacterium]